jgi:methylmalonyl-CoA decarboxylase subunit alpha
MSETQTGIELQRALEAALGGGPERHHQKTAEQGKLPVRERIQLLVDPESFAEEALLANWEQEGLGADGVVTGLALVGGRRVALMPNGRASTGERGAWRTRSTCSSTGRCARARACSCARR